MIFNAKDYDSDQYGVIVSECGHYVDSENSFLEAYQILQTKQKDEKYNFYMYAFYGNMAECLILQDRLQEAKTISGVSA